MNNSNNVQRNLWDKLLVISQIMLTIFTLLYVILTTCVVKTMGDQNELSTKTFQESIKPLLYFELDSLRFLPTTFKDHPQ